MPTKHSIILNGIMLSFVSTRIYAQTVTLNGQLRTEDTKDLLPEVAITAASLSKPVAVIKTTTGTDGGFTIKAKPGMFYRLCSAATGRYAESCQFSKPVIVKADSELATVQMMATSGIKIRVRIIDSDGLLGSPKGSFVSPDPLLLHVFAGNRITRTHFPLQLQPSSSVSDAYEAYVVIPIDTSWNVAMSSNRANLFDSNGKAYQSNEAIPRPSEYGNDEFLAVYTLRAR